MIRRRRNVIFLVLLLGVGWFIVRPLLSANSSTDELKQNIGHRLSVDKFDVPDDVENLRSLKKVAKNNLAFQYDVKDANGDDLSEIEYLHTELPKHPFVEVKKDSLRLYSASTMFPLATRFLRGRIVSLKRISFNQFNPPGDRGRMVRIDPKSLSSNDREIYDSGWAKYYHNEYVNGLISPDRVLPDVREPGCRSLDYTIQDLKASVIIVVHNEAWMTLLRTIHSVVNRTSARLLKEIILVDDASTFDHLSSRLTEYASRISKIRLVRLQSRRGASYARHLGASFATGDVLVFLDSHCECTKGWLEPLLSHVAQDASNVAMPVVDIIDDDTFAYRAYDAMHIRLGGFDWSLAYKWIEIPDYEKRRRKSNIDPLRNPVMWGGIFAISRSFFNSLEGYNQTLHMSGAGQNIEMSFKIWLCGGTIETLPCSHVGHLFRNRNNAVQLFNSESLMNYAAVAHMWLDEFKDMHFKKVGFVALPQVNNSVGHLAFRKRLQCRSFVWFLRNVYRDLYTPLLAIASGKIRSKVKMSSASEDKAFICLALTYLGSEKKLGVSKCHSSDDKNKLWTLSRTGEIRQGDDCLDFPGVSIIIYPCHGGRGNQEWTYKEDGTIRQVGTKRCLTLSSDRRFLTMEQCSASDHQTWHWRRNSEAELQETVTEKQIAVKQELAKVNI